MNNLENLKAYKILQKEELKEVNGTGYVLEHIKTKAQVAVVTNDDENKVFSIGFRTPPTNSKGIQHIIEHTVLCGSEKYPVKDPFIELAKGSLNTFLNAMTYPDRTIYPIASLNAQDYHNLMDVYLDAVFHPNIYKYPEIFQQEGWHYEMTDPKDDLTINGIVYNEMRGVYSSPDSLLSSAINELLFPDSIYSRDSGGDPELIPDLTREEYLEYHRDYYHPSNSYIYLYGDMDAEKELDYIDQEYLSKYDYKKTDSEIKLQESIHGPKELVSYYPISEEDQEDDRTTLTYNVILPTEELDKKVQLAFDILGYVLTTVPGAPLKMALQDAGLGSEVDWSDDFSSRQAGLSITLTDSSLDKQEKFVEIINKTLSDIVKNGLDKETLSAAINHYEFEHKEGNFGHIPKGLSIGLAAYAMWIYDAGKALDVFSMDECYDFFKENMDKGYFEKLIQDYVLDNDFKAFVANVPKKGLNEEKEARLAEKLAKLKASLSQQEVEDIIANTKHLKAYQAESSSPEDLKKVPLLQISDIGKEAMKLNNKIVKVADTDVNVHDYFTNGISYVSILMPIDDFTLEEYQYLALDTMIFQEVDTDQHSFAQLSNEIDREVGGLGFDVSVAPIKNVDYISHFVAAFKALDSKVDSGFQLIKEIISTSHLEDLDRVKQIIAEALSAGRVSLVASGHTNAMRRATSYISKSAFIDDAMSGIEFYYFLQRVDKLLKINPEQVVASMKASLAKALRKEKMLISFTSQLEPEALEKSIRDFSSILSDEKIGAKKDVKLVKKNEGLYAASQVQYVACSGNFRDAGFDTNGALRVLHTILSYDYLWTQVRVLGGAYGCMCTFPRSGYSSFVSYRDPNCKSTLDVYKGVVDYVRNFDCDERDMTKYIIGSIAKMDAPMNSRAKGNFSNAAFLTGVTDQDLQKEREQVLACKPEDIRALAPYMEAIISTGAVAAIGGEDKIRENKDCFLSIKNLFGDNE